MKYGWLIGTIAALDLGVKQVVEGQEDETFPRDLPCAKGWVTLHKYHNEGFPFGFLKKYPTLVKTLPLMVTSALAGGLAALWSRKDALLEKLGLAVMIGGSISNIYDRVARGYVVDYFTIQWKGLKKVIFNLGDLFVFLGAILFAAGQMIKEVKTWKAKKGA